MRYYCFSLLKVAIKYILSRCHLATFLERYKRKKISMRGKEFVVKALSSFLTESVVSLWQQRSAIRVWSQVSKDISEMGAGGEDPISFLHT